jgi:L-lactate dehydrogenase complex protein LldG
MAAAHEAVREALRGLNRCASAVAELDEFPRPGTRTLDDLSILDALVCRGAFGVVENGAVWLPETLVESRAWLFLTDSLFVILSADDLVADMHQACHRLAHGRTEGFGTFMAGPSKTADIEQALVIGAQGPRRMTIVLVDGDGEE